MHETIVYGDEDIIKMLVTNSYDNIKDKITSFDDTYLVGKLIDILNDDDTTIDLIKTLSGYLTDMDFHCSQDSEELVKVIQSLRPRLIGLYAKKSQNDFRHWFEVPKLAKEIGKEKE